MKQGTPPPRDERMAGHLPMWAWEAMQELPPFAPDYEPISRPLTDEERQTVADRWNRAYTDGPPLDAESVTGEPFAPSTPYPDFLDWLHEIQLSDLKRRLPDWERTAREDLSPSVRLTYWQTKRDAVRLAIDWRYLDPNDLDSHEFLYDLNERVQLAEDAARWAGPEEEGEAKTAKPPTLDATRLRDTTSRWRFIVEEVLPYVQANPRSSSMWRDAFDVIGEACNGAGLSDWRPYQSADSLRKAFHQRHKRARQRGANG